MFTITIIIHEAGHFLLGLLSGYRLIHIEVFGFSLERIGGRLKLKRYKNSPLGQCMMYTENESTDPFFFAAGGIIFNLVFAALFLKFAIVLNIFPLKLLFLIEGSTNLSAAVYNLFLGSDYCDGKTLREIRNGNAVFYNRIMLIAKFLREGKSYRDMPEEIFLCDAGQKYHSTLEKDMHMHRNRFLTEKGEKTDAAETGSPLKEIIEKALKEIENRGNDFEKVFGEIINLAKVSMYPGEYLSAARCFAVLRNGL